MFTIKKFDLISIRKLSIYLIIGYTIVLSFTGCAQKKQFQDANTLNSFDISPNGKHIVFSYAFNSKGSLYKANIDGTEVKLLTDSNSTFFSESPRCSPDGESIVFLRSTPGSLKSSMWLTNINGDNLTQLTDSSNLIMEAVFSKDGQYIYFTRANDYAAYSPIGRKAPHSLRLKDNKTSKISNLKAYGLYSISDIGNQILFNMRGEEEGVFFYKKDGGRLNKVVTVNDTLTNSTGYSNPLMIDTAKLIAASYYQLVSIDLNSKIEALVLPSNGNHFKVVRYNQINDKLYFTKTDGTNSIYSVNLDGSDLRDIPIRITGDDVKQ